MFLIVGLGNPGSEYEYNRHNIGFLAADAIVRAHGLSGPKKKFDSQLFEGSIAGTRVLLIKPQTYMNVSGVAVHQAAEFYKIPPSNVIAIHDELDLEFGKLRIKVGGGNAGHNGLRSIDANFDVDYKRLRFGIGHPGHKDLVSSYVLHDFSKAEWQEAEKIAEKIGEHFGILLSGDDAGFLNKVTNSK